MITKASKMKRENERYSNEMNETIQSEHNAINLIDSDEVEYWRSN